MNHLLKAVLLIAGLACATGAQAAAYKCQDDSGRTVYSDIPCAKKAPPAPKPEAAKAAAKADAAVVTKISEADVLRTLGQAEDLTRQNNHAELCSMQADDLKFSMQNQTLKPPRTWAGGKTEMCNMVKENAEQSKRTGMITQIDRGATKVVIEPGETRATATYEATVKATRFDRIISTHRCTGKDQFTLNGGKLFYVSSEAVCKP